MPPVPVDLSSRVDSNGELCLNVGDLEDSDVQGKACKRQVSVEVKRVSLGMRFPHLCVCLCKA